MSDTPKILVTGGCGYIGSHTTLALIEAGFSVVLFDSMVNSHPKVLEAMCQLSGQNLPLIVGDVRDESALNRLMASHQFQAVMHCAGLKSVSESVENPLAYYDVNFGGSMNVIRQMEQHGIRHLVFSSSATVYGVPKTLPVSEKALCSPNNPYGHSKHMVEILMSDWVKTGTPKTATVLRYFNPVGAHPSGDLGEDPRGVPNNLMPYVAQVAIGRREELQVFGSDYATADGTGVRDYIHVMDLAEGHVSALKWGIHHPGFKQVNLGTGKGVSVLEVIGAFEKASGHPIAYVIKPRRIGDVASNWADPTLAHELWGWKAKRNLNQMCQDAWRWQSKHPSGYANASSG